MRVERRLLSIAYFRHTSQRRMNYNDDIILPWLEFHPPFSKFGPFSQTFRRAQFKSLKIEVVVAKSFTHKYAIDKCLSCSPVHCYSTCRLRILPQPAVSRLAPDVF